MYGSLLLDQTKDESFPLYFQSHQQKHWSEECMVHLPHSQGTQSLSRRALVDQMSTVQ